MNREIRPQPSPEELEAIEEALARRVEPLPGSGSLWWRAGVREAVSDEEETA